jgi:hypothetical protein
MPSHTRRLHNNHNPRVSTQSSSTCPTDVGSPAQVGGPSISLKEDACGADTACPCSITLAGPPHNNEGVEHDDSIGRSRVRLVQPSLAGLA